MAAAAHDDLALDMLWMLPTRSRQLCPGRYRHPRPPASPAMGDVPAAPLTRVIPPWRAVPAQRRAPVPGG